MIRDIFSIFDPANFTLLFPSTTIAIILNIILIIIIQPQIWKFNQRKNAINLPIIEVIITQLSRTISFNLKGMSSIVTTLFVAIIIINLMGIIPYSLSSSRHLIITLSIGLPIWLSIILSSFSYSPKKSIAHFLPDGAPEWLNPFLVIIETTRIIVRPITLSFRLAANMTAGHIVLTLIRLYCVGAIFSSTSSFLFLLTLSRGYIAFELAICLIQAYIFCLLLSLYSDDHAH